MTLVDFGYGYVICTGCWWMYVDATEGAAVESWFVAVVGVVGSCAGSVFGYSSWCYCVGSVE